MDLKPGMFVKVRRGRDGWRLRRIYEINGDYMIVDHFRWVRTKKARDDGTIEVTWKVKRRPYASEVPTSSVVQVYDITPEGYLAHDWSI